MSTCTSLCNFPPNSWARATFVLFRPVQNHQHFCHVRTRGHAHSNLRHTQNTVTNKQNISFRNSPNNILSSQLLSEKWWSLRSFSVTLLSRVTKCALTEKCNCSMNSPLFLCQDGTPTVLCATVNFAGHFFDDITHLFPPCFSLLITASKRSF